MSHDEGPTAPTKASRRLRNIGAIGEELVKYHLLARGWDVINLNLIGNNRPNADLLAVKEKHVVRLQVKTSQYLDWVQLGWITEGKSVINSRVGDKADFFVMVGHVGPENYSIHIVPTDVLVHWEQRNAVAHAFVGRKSNPGYVYFGVKTRKSKIDINKSGAEFSKYRNAWHLLEP